MDFKNLNIPLVGYGLFITLFHVSEYNREVSVYNNNVFDLKVRHVYRKDKRDKVF